MEPLDWQNGRGSFHMKHLSLFHHIVRVCGLIAVLAMANSCSSVLSPEKAVRRLVQSPVTTVFSHNSKHFPNHRDCYEVGPLPERARRALVTWLHDSTIKEMSYVYPQYYLTTLNAKGGGEVVWAILSDGRGNMVGVLIPDNKRIPAWDLPTVGPYKVHVCDTYERDALSAAIMGDLADPVRKPGTEVGYDQERINALKATGLTDKQYLISKPRGDEASRQVKRGGEEKPKAEQKADKSPESTGETATPTSEEELDDTSSSDDESTDSSEDGGDADSSSDDSLDDGSDSSSGDDSEGGSDDTSDTDSDSEI